ncbi:MAG TPA: chlorite dismutase family protein [Verrucomicrobiae bacterium]|jgi:peroxiredoxin|nr:chlorite dismutase family protein [Verrucomicrobiae bacterium]
MMHLPEVKLNQGIHVMHLFYRIDRTRWVHGDAVGKLEALCAVNKHPSHPRLVTYANVGGKADLAFLLQAAELGQVGQLHRDLEACFAPGTLVPVFSYLSVTELSEYMPSEDDNRQILIQQEKLAPESEAFTARMAELGKKRAEYEQYRLYPELPDWEVMGFYPMSKRREGADNWYTLDFATRKRLMGGHARVGRKYAGRVSQLITGSTGLEGWEWGVTLMAHQVDALKEIVYEMRFDEVTARYGEFGPFFVNLRLAPPALWKHLHL